MNYHKILTNLMAQPKGENRHSTYWVLIRHDISNEFTWQLDLCVFLPSHSKAFLQREHSFRYLIPLEHRKTLSTSPTGCVINDIRYTL